MPFAKGKSGNLNGRPKGSITKPRLLDFYTQKELNAFVKDLKKSAKSDPIIKKFVAEQLFGKAVQPIGNEDGKPLIVQFDKAFVGNATSSSPKRNSSK